VWVVEDALSGLDDEASNVRVLTSITWGKHVRLRRFGTQHYLCVLTEEASTSSPAVTTTTTTTTTGAAGITTSSSSSLEQQQQQQQQQPLPSTSTKETSEILSLALTTQRRDPRTLWAFIPVRKELEQEVTFGANILLQSVATKFWLHCTEELVGSVIEMKGYTESEVSCIRKFNYKDAFQVKAVPATVVDAYTFVEKQLSLLRTYYQRIVPFNTFYIQFILSSLLSLLLLLSA
jgi:hypothetical protein